MIEPHNLRMGNIVLLNGKLHTILNGKAIDELSQLVEGVLISDELLSQHGYMIDFTSGGYTFYAHPQLTVFFKLCKFDAGGIKFRLCFTVGQEAYSPNLGGNFRYLHELQNLHFYITKFELTNWKSINDRLNQWSV